MQYAHIPLFDANDMLSPLLLLLLLLLHLFNHPFLFLPQRKRLVGPDEVVAAC
jgi:hypothetical protein